MLNLPSHTEINRPLPKTQLLQALADIPAHKRSVIDSEISRLVLVNEISNRTCNLGFSSYSGVYVVSVMPRRLDFNAKALEYISANIPQKFVYAVDWGDDNARAFVWYDGKLYASPPTPASRFALTVNGNTVEAAFEGFIRQIAGLADTTASLQEAIAAKNKIANLEKQIATLQSKIRKEKQFNKQVEMNGEARALKKQLAELKLKTNN